MKGINAEMTNNYSEQFCTSFNLKNLIKQPTYFQNLEIQRVSNTFLQTTQKDFIRQVFMRKVCLTSIN